jgi:predicted nucleotidyltransferase
MAMDKDSIIAKLNEHRAELQRLGVVSASLFGSRARGDDGASSDIDIAVKLDPARTPKGLDYIGFVDAIQERLESFLQIEVDVVPEPAGKQRLQEQIDKDRVVAF